MTERSANISHCQHNHANRFITMTTGGQLWSLVCNQRQVQELLQRCYITWSKRKRKEPSSVQMEEFLLAEQLIVIRDKRILLWFCYVHYYVPCTKQSELKIVFQYANFNLAHHTLLLYHYQLTSYQYLEEKKKHRLKLTDVIFGDTLYLVFCLRRQIQALCQN